MANLSPQTKKRMGQLPTLPLRPLRTLVVLAASCLLASAASAQTLSGSVNDLWPEPVLPRNLGGLFTAGNDSAAAVCRSPRIRMFRMPTAFLSDPLGLDDNDPLPPDAPPPSKDEGPVGVALGNDNPFFDFQMPGDPGGVGYYRLHTQVQLVGSSRTGLCLGMQALTPAGLEADGLADGPTFVSPHLAWFQEVGNGAAIQAFVGKSMRASWHPGEQPAVRGLRYGLAFQSPLLPSENAQTQKVHLFVEALGMYRLNADLGPASAVNWELVPGVHWRMNDSWWLSGGVLVPLGETPAQREGRFQITCSWQF
jgi:hypothetical protein